MKLDSRLKLLWLVIAGVGCLILVLFLWPVKPQPQTTLDLRLAGVPQMTNGGMLMSIVLSNRTLKTLNIVDDGVGNPFMVLDAGATGNMPGTIGFGIGKLSNTLKLNLAPGAALTNAVLVTNPPPRFRILAEVRDLSSERRRTFMYLARLLAVKARLAKPDLRYSVIMLPASPWIENGKVSNMTENGTQELRDVPPQSAKH